MAYDFKKEYKEFYKPSKKPSIVTLPTMNFLAVKGKGNPNQKDGEYQQAIGMLYAVAYTLKMSYKGTYKIEDFFEYVVPPLEGLWWMENNEKPDYENINKDQFHWISCIRLPDFIKEKDVEWAKETVFNKKKTDVSKVEFMTYEEGLCVQCMHIGSFDQEAETVRNMEAYAYENGYVEDMEERHHHEIYLSDPRKSSEDKWKTVIRHPIKLKK